MCKTLYVIFAFSKLFVLNLQLNFLDNSNYLFYKHFIEAFPKI